MGRAAVKPVSTVLSGSPAPHGTRQHRTSAASEATVRDLGGGQPNRCGSAQAASPAPGWLPAAGPCIWLSSRPNEPGSTGVARPGPREPRRSRHKNNHLAASALSCDTRAVGVVTLLDDFCSRISFRPRARVFVPYLRTDISPSSQRFHGIDEMPKQLAYQD